MRCCGHNGLPKVSESLPLESLSSLLCRYNNEDGARIFLCHLSGAKVTPRIFLKERGRQEKQAKVRKWDSGSRGPIKRDMRRWLALREEDGPWSKDACDLQKLEEARNVAFPSDLDRMVTSRMAR